MKIEKISKGSIFLLSELKKDYKAIMKNFLFDLTDDEINKFKNNIDNISGALNLNSYNFMYTGAKIKEIEKYKKENAKKIAYSSMKIFLITEMYNPSESDDAKPYLLQFYGREYGGSGSGLDCIYELQPILLKLNENESKLYQNIPKLNDVEDIALESLKKLNLNKEIINKIIKIMFNKEDDNCFLYNSVTFELVKLEENY